MTISIPDVYIHSANESVVLQGASQAAIDYLRLHYALHNGTTALAAHEAAEEAFEGIDRVGLYTMMF